MQKKRRVGNELMETSEITGLCAVNDDGFVGEGSGGWDDKENERQHLVSQSPAEEERETGRTGEMVALTFTKQGSGASAGRVL
ncbi:hypothetical protein NPX13_g8392 [Xylaria arbuscula]|uniref:Uncharacterized protein n=1 Tax=Xylaria arbuscula TaxID=114810 RepID=A0A9W8N8S0_9PEZI|nr:hypothetical protein NPX13_g8392 [Xylaria arbuscula]